MKSNTIADVHVIRKNRVGKVIECKGGSVETFNGVVQKASEEVIFEQSRRPVNSDV